METKNESSLVTMAPAESSSSDPQGIEFNNESNLVKPNSIEDETIATAELVVESNPAIISPSQDSESNEFSIPRRLHPISLGFEIFAGIRQQFLPVAFALFSAARGGFWGLLIGVGFLFVSITHSVFKYLTLRYQIQGDDLIVDEGVFFRVHRTVPLKKIQNVDLLQNPFHRLFHVAEVRIETASGTEPEATLRVISLREIDRMRSRIFADRESAPKGRVADSIGVDETSNSSDQANSDDSIPLLKLSLPMLIKAGLVSNKGMIMVAILLGTFYQLDPWEYRVSFDFDSWNQWLPAGNAYVVWSIVGGAAILFALIALRVLSAIWYVLRFYGYELHRNGEDLRIRCGLLTKVSANVPRNRIQFISIHRTWIGKLIGIGSIRIETAGGGADKSEDAASTISRQWFIPSILECDIPRILAELRPGLIWDEGKIDWKPLSIRAATRMRRLGLVAVGLGLLPAIYFRSSLTVLLVLALGGLVWWYAGKKAKSNRYARGPFGVAYRSGLFVRKCSLTFPEAVQAVRLERTPFDRKWKMATLRLDTAASGPAGHTIEVSMLDAQFAMQERDAIALLASNSSVIGVRVSV